MEEDVDGDPITFDTSPTDDVEARLRAEVDRSRRPTPILTRGTPRPGLPPVLASARLPVPTPSPVDSDPGDSLDELTVEHLPLPALLEEGAPLDRDATEGALLAAIASGDEPSRLIYADWLEERAEHARASFLRIEQVTAKLEPADPRFEGCSRQLRELAQHIDPDWRARIARTAIEHCPMFEYSCPQRWDALALTDQEDVRHCSSCAKHVRYFETVDDAREAARAGHCVAIELGSERWEDDLVDIGTRCTSCSRRVVSRARFCPHCGTHIERLMMVGRLARD